MSATNTFTLTVQNVNDAPTVANLIADQWATQGTAFNFVVAANTFADVDVGDSLIYNDTLANGAALPTWLSFNPTTRTFSGTPGSGDAGLLTIKVTATDSGNLSAVDLFDLWVNSLDQILTGTAGNDGLTGGVGNDQLFGLAGNDTLIGGGGNDLLDGGTGADTMRGGTGNDAYVVNQVGDVVTEQVGQGIDTVKSSIGYALGTNVENLILAGTMAANGKGNGLNNLLTGNGANNVLTGAGGNDTFRGSAGNDTLNGGSGNDTYLFDRGDGKDFIRDNSGTADKLLYDSGIDPLDLVISRQANDLRLTIHGSTDSVTIQNWYASSSNRTEMIQTGNGQMLLNTQVNQLIQAMAGFTQQTGLTWDQAIDQRPQDVQAVLAANWQ